MNWMVASLLKKAVSGIRNQLESAKEQEVEVIDVDAPSIGFVDVTESKCSTITGCNILGPMTCLYCIIVNANASVS